MNYPKMYCFFVIFVAANSLVTFSQSHSTQNIIISPTASSFAYPQSLFVDSSSGHIWVTDFSNHRILRFDVSSLTSVGESGKLSSPQNFFLSQNYPNPFNAETQITFSTQSIGNVVLSVYNLLGEKISTLFDGTATTNKIYSITFDAKNLPSGVYLYSFRTINGSVVKRMCLLK